MTYPETTQYLESFINYENIPAYPYKESLTLERIRGFLEAIGSPQYSLKCIHVAGTKGKGSTCAFLTYILRQAGYKVGLYTSPHLSDFRERIRILKRSSVVSRQSQEDFEGAISKDALNDLTETLRPAIDKYNKNSKYGSLSFFEVYTALAFIYFKEKKVDFAVLETGLGGRLDATNVVNPLACVITPISYEHTQKLGNTLREIATEKAGIIKSCQPIVITAPQGKEAMEVIRNKCVKVGAKLYAVGKDITFKVQGSGFRVQGLTARYKNLRIGLLGRHQLINAAVAIGATEALGNYGINVSAGSIKKGLYNTVWPGRCEVIAKNPFIVLDGAQNVASSKALKQTIKESFKYKKLILVLGISSDKDIKGICSQLYDLADTVILTQSHNPRAAKSEVLAGYFNGKDTCITANITEAGGFASGIAQKEDLVLVTGSLFVVGEFRRFIICET